MSAAFGSRFSRVLVPALACMLVGFVTLPAEAGGEGPAPEAVRVLSFNLWHGGDAGRQPIEQTLAVIRESGADVVGLQETEGLAPEGEPRPDRGAELAERLGWHHLDQGGRTAIISRFEIVDATPGRWGAALVLPSGRRMYAFNAHLAHSPYQPYQLLGIPYGDGAFIETEAEAIREAREARGGQVGELLAEVGAVLPEGLPVVITGDFNEPSHRDWTAAAAAAGLCPLGVRWPSTGAVEAAGFVDAYRAVHPDPASMRGLTWTPTTEPGDPGDRHDRIDFVFVSGGDRPTVRVAECLVVGESGESADLVVTPYPSDHRAVVAELLLLDDGPTPAPSPSN
ncbi:endonuclease/exonuclease/phosphatase family protein [Tautonia plasticadhaerens]|uniref:Endonuclease/Exonuclease/phosphatase family protein n=1 Tax=Tautonia plasticadhaerens TaxID=2527974 RepID=A0A518GZ39_9BACT|nr:endonuclease/exonuclease/phosphatase family protein [Tautonia plasticadhaerens]QDV33880.1 Endonuclease/Exonuclease/phosphatase family protein [Tautonia plasticadhaerens]